MPILATDGTPRKVPNRPDVHPWTHNTRPTPPSAYEQAATDDPAGRFPTLTSTAVETEEQAKVIESLRKTFNVALTWFLHYLPPAERDQAREQLLRFLVRVHEHRGRLVCVWTEPTLAGVCAIELGAEKVYKTVIAISHIDVHGDPL